MVKTLRRRQQGFVEKVSCKETRHKGLYSHRLKVKGQDYTYLDDSNISRVELGDMVRFQWISKKSRRGWITYRNIVDSTLEIVRTAEEWQRADGFVYLLTNAAMSGLVKIGFTTGSPEDRARQLSAVTSVPKSFEVAWSIAIVGNAELVERTVHARLESCREGKEFFRISVETAKRTITEVYRHLYPEQRGLSDSHVAREKAYLKARQQFKEEENQRKKTVELAKANEEARRLRMIRPAEDSIALPFELHEHGIRIKVYYQELDPRSWLAQRIFSGDANFEDYRGWRVEAEWNRWWWTNGFADHFKTRQEAFLKASEAFTKRGYPPPAGLRDT